MSQVLSDDREIHLEVDLKPDVVTLGEPMVEFCATGTGRLGQVELFKRGWGGDTSNFAVAAARTGSKVSHLCRLGDDEFSRSFTDLWAREGVDASHVIVEPEAWTAIYIISLVEGGGHDFTYYRAGSAASRYKVDDLPKECVASAKVFHTSGISLAVSQSLREAALHAMELSRDSGGLTTFDINMRTKLWPIHTAKASIEYAFHRANTVFASVDDVKTLYGVSDPVKVANHIRGMGVDTVVIKRGDKGCYVASEEESFACPGFSVKPVDTTGSGDAFDGAWVTATLEEWNIRRRAKFANAVGAITATGLGAVAPIPRREQALKLMETNG